MYIQTISLEDLQDLADKRILDKTVGPWDLAFLEPHGVIQVERIEGLEIVEHPYYPIAVSWVPGFLGRDRKIYILAYRLDIKDFGIAIVSKHSHGKLRDDEICSHPSPMCNWLKIISYLYSDEIHKFIFEAGQIAHELHHVT